MIGLELPIEQRQTILADLTPGAVRGKIEALQAAGAIDGEAV